MLSTHASHLERELYIAEMMAGIVERVRELSEWLDALDKRVAALERPNRKSE